MTTPSLGTLIAGLCGIALLSGCAARRAEVAGAAGAAEAQTGLYRVSVRDPVQGQRRFRLLLFAELPDRLHGEVLSPVGNVLLILDGGAERMAVTFVRDRIAFVGPAEDDALARVLGLRLSLENLVAGLLTGQAPPGSLRVIREGPGSPALPTLLILEDGDRSVSLELKRLQPLRAATALLGTGQFPEGMEIRPLSELSLYDMTDALPEEPGP